MPNVQYSEVEDFFQHRLDSQPARPQVRPIVGVDECLGGPQIAREMNRLCREHVVQYVTPCWWDITRDGNGDLAHAVRFPAPRHRMLPSHQRVRGASWPDSEVMWQLVAQFQMGDGVFFLSENLRRDADGIRGLLQEIVGPLLNAWHRQRYWLAVLWKRGTTPVSEYAPKAADFIRQHRPTFGYEEHEL